MWEGWRLEARTSDPYYKNILCIVLRRKFLAPFYNTFQSFHFVISEDISREKYEVNPKSYEILELAADTIYYSSKMLEKEYLLFIKAKIDSLLIEEETMIFLQNSMNIMAPEVYDLGYEFVYSILVLLEYNTKEKSKIGPIRFSLEQKIKSLNQIGDLTYDLTINPNNIKLSKIIKSLIDLIKKDQDEQSNENEQIQLDESPKEDNVEEDTKSSSDKGVTQTPKLNKNDFLLKFDKWRRKVFRFLGFCINGGLTDHMFTFEMFIDMANRVQNNSLYLELNEFIFYAMNITDLDAVITEEQSKIYIPSLTERTNLIFNEDILCVCIKTGWLSKYMSESVKHAPTFMNLLLTKYCSNKILSAIYNYLKLINEQIGDEGSTEERNSLSLLIPKFVEIYSDIRRCPSTLFLAAKCMCALVSKETDSNNIKMMIQEDIVLKITIYFDYYDFDTQLLIISLELFSFILNELKPKINEYLSDIKGVNLMTSFKNMLNSTKVPGCYYSQRVNFLYRS